jgi:hypothetical protein
MKIIKSADCGNSPKNLLVQEICIAYIKRDFKFFKRFIADEAKLGDIWQVGDNGKAALSDVIQVRINHPISHGKSGAAEYTVHYKDKQTEQFCLFVEFDSAAGKKNQRLERYVLQKR